MSALYYLYHLVSSGNDFATLRKLLEEGQNPNVQDVRGDTLLHLAVFKHVAESKTNLQVVRELIYFGANVNHGNKLGNTPLHFAVARRNYKMMRILLNCNAEIHKQDSFGNTAMHYAINNKQLLQRISSNSSYQADCSPADLEAVKLLMKYCPNINVFNYRFETPLIWAVQQQNLQIFKILVEKGAFLSLKDLYGNGALHYALDQTEINVKIVAELIRRGCSHDSKNAQSVTPVDVYLKALYSASSTEQEKAKCFFKLFVFKNNIFSNTHFRKIAVISKKQKSLLSNFFWYCRFEIEQMKSDDFAEDYTVYDLATWGFYSYSSAMKAPSHNNFHKVLGKLKNGEYIVYCDVIVSGICKDYLSTKTAETGYWMNEKGERKEFLNFDMRFLLCYYYLTNFEIFNLMLAFSSSSSFCKICKICTILYEKL